ncbi:hypothetical protein [Bacillus sp. 7894-2]|uniref:hypothetical protein n=1 Tax=Bacillus sp. 7894-2 TaxID=2021695 RepID=UPI000BA603A7|nr:hypothetical protein [Bacillus sp. 7894-2]PAE24014.1 hypothetical protein CHI10_14505 [Bacillus sp. 7894-2]
MPKISTKDWRNLSIEKWNTSTIHAYLIDRNKELYGVTYEPFGSGPVSRRWATEKGQIKNALTTYGAPVVKEYIDRCFASHKLNPKYPVLSFGFMFSYLRTELQQAELSVKRKQQRAEAVEAEEANGVDEEWF